MLFRPSDLKETTMIVQHVLVPLDFSATADRALDYAIALAQQLHARLTLLHVFDLTPLTMGDAATGIPVTAVNELEIEVQHLLQASLEQVQRTGLQGESLLVQGTPTQTIVDVAGEQGVDLIVMGTHGRTGLAHVFLGSVAEHVIRQAPCPVLVMRKTMDVSDTPATSEDTTPAHP
jgi:nucleotide-binding universal stress UspA family protein